MKYFIALFIIMFCSYMVWVMMVSNLNITPWKKPKEINMSIDITKEGVLMSSWYWVKVPQGDDIDEYKGPIPGGWKLTVCRIGG